LQMQHVLNLNKLMSTREREKLATEIYSLRWVRVQSYILTTSTWQVTLAITFLWIILMILNLTQGLLLSLYATIRHINGQSATTRFATLMGYTKKSQPAVLLTPHCRLYQTTS